MPAEPAVKRAHVFIDGQNLFYAVKVAFGYTFPNYDVVKLSKTVCERQGWELTAITFYTGVPLETDNAHWHGFWVAKLAAMGSRGVVTESRPLKYRNKTIRLADDSVMSVLVGQEKGIDVKLALDLVRFARQGEYDVAVVFSQDQDLAEAADEAKRISIEHGRWIKTASVYPISPTYLNDRGINGTEWIKMDKEIYDTCLDPANYSPQL